MGRPRLRPADNAAAGVLHGEGQVLRASNTHTAEGSRARGDVDRRGGTVTVAVQRSAVLSLRLCVLKLNWVPALGLT